MSSCTRRHAPIPNQDTHCHRDDRRCRSTTLLEIHTRSTVKNTYRWKVAYGHRLSGSQRHPYLSKRKTFAMPVSLAFRALALGHRIHDVPVAWPKALGERARNDIRDAVPIVGARGSLA